MGAATSGELCRRARELDSEFGLALNSPQINGLGIYLDVLLKWRERINLVAESDGERLLRFHFLESFWLAKHFLDSDSVVTDVGTGAGFPGLAAAVYRPSMTVTLVEKNPKKVVFLEEVIRRLELADVTVFPGVWEDYRDWRPGGITSIRALRASPGLVERLAAAGQRVLLLHTSDLGREWDPYRVVRQLRVPRSEHRRATELAVREAPESIAGGPFREP